MHQLDTQDRAGAQQPRIHERAAVVHIGVFRDAADSQGRAQRGGQPDDIFVEGPPGAHHRPGMVVDEAEQVRFPASDHGPVQCVTGPQLIGPAGLEPAEHLLLPVTVSGGAVQLEPPEQPLQGPVGRRPAAAGTQNPLDLRGGALRVLALQRRGQVQHLSRGPRGDLPRRRHQRLEPAVQVGPLPPVDALIRHPDRLTGRPGVRSGGKPADPAAALRGRQVRADHLLDQRVPEQRDRPRLLQPPPVVLFITRHSVSFLHVPADAGP